MTYREAFKVQLAAGGCKECSWTGPARDGWLWWVRRRAIRDARVHAWYEHGTDWRIP